MVNERSYKISSCSDEYDEYDDENNPIEDIIEELNYCRQDYYKLHKRDNKTASIRLRQRLEIVIQTAKQLKRDVLIYRKEIEAKQKRAKDEAKKYYKEK